MLNVVVALLGLVTSSPPDEYYQQVVVDLYDYTDVSVVRSLQEDYGFMNARLNSRYSANTRVYLVEFESVKARDSALYLLRKDLRVERVERNAVYRAQSLPDDPMYGKQWNFHSIGVAEAWKHTRGKGAVVAVLDTGVTLASGCKHTVVEDLDGISHKPGYDFDADKSVVCDGHGHGTHVTGTIAQLTNNGKGVSGIAYEATIIPVKVLSDSGGGSLADIADGIRFAADNGANVINLSLGGPFPSIILESAVKYARAKGAVVVAAAGNDGSRSVIYPAGYPGVVAVSASGPTGELAPYSNYGPSIFVGAPGGDTTGGDEDGVLQNVVDRRDPTNGSQYDWYQGTSMATPHVTGLVALLVSLGMTNVDAIERTLRESANNPGDEDKTEEFGHGIIQVDRAVEMADSDMLGGPFDLLVAIVLFCLMGPRFFRTMGANPVSAGLFGLGMVVGSSGVWLLDGTFVDSIPVLGTMVTEPGPMWDSMLVGTWAHGSLLWWSCLPPLTLLLLVLHKPRWRNLAIGIFLGWTAHLISAAIQPKVDLWGGIDPWWLGANVVALLVFIVALARKAVHR